MKNLITAARTDLRENIAYVSDRNIWIATDFLIIPEWIKFPAIAVKDGKEAFAPAYQDGEGIIQRLSVAAYAEYYADNEKSIMDEHGVLAMIEDIKTRLNNNTLEQTGIILAVAESATASTPIFNDRAQMGQMKTITFRYEKLTDY